MEFGVIIAGVLGILVGVVILVVVLMLIPSGHRPEPNQNVRCACFERPGDNLECPVHGQIAAFLQQHPMDSTQRTQLEQDLRKMVGPVQVVDVRPGVWLVDERPAKDSLNTRRIQMGLSPLTRLFDRPEDRRLMERLEKWGRR